MNALKKPKEETSRLLGFLGLGTALNNIGIFKRFNKQRGGQI